MFIKIFLVTIILFVSIVNSKSINIVSGESVGRNQYITTNPNCTTPNITRLYQFIDSTVASYDYCEGTEWAFSNFDTAIYSENSDNGQQTASTIKLWIMMAVLQDINNGLYNLNTVIQCSGQTITIDACLELMIGISDNCATYDMAKQTTLNHVNQLFKQLGMVNSGFHEWCFTTCPGYTSPCPNDDGTGIENTLTSHDVITGLTQLHNFQALGMNATYQAYKYLLTAHGWTPMLGRFVPTPVAHKQGWLPADDGYQPFTENDEAIVFTECGDYAASVMITRNWTNPQEDTNALNLGAQIGRLAYCTMVPFGTANDGTLCSETWSQPLPSPTGC
ncbi:beta-lactamase-type transpeptidase fold containing protein [Heterostelium album PN500]|uniref:Beta-lactamase-type transpeptidase fold containing protein n=1 Tax=Heterostelium pallidum (strain ATCC 26659 / Pp 5 / PN500) TaxID=670386 RepID=D3B0F1_HETP5|nr:beta-lactamase-type transpeptidase fold containing protein [Heterostelium album PN500]EFA84775.1 beta-lactamase-type transpeptidase fold containing protein [Heterostelium album PN500]|eukprot:XP_020436887.1 beta-lactamase-type transpeptidase fold containing protein [Heterostelium album PN500]